MPIAAMIGSKAGILALIATTLPRERLNFFLGTLVVAYTSGVLETIAIIRRVYLTNISRYGITHEQFVWDLKSEPGLIDKFAQLWKTQELLVSYGKKKPLRPPGLNLTDTF